MIRLWSYNAIRAREITGKLTLTERAILFRSSPRIHSELQFTEFREVSCSATMQDRCKCTRFKFIQYPEPSDIADSKWDCVDISCSYAQEENIFYWCLDKAGLWKYDLWGLLSFVSKSKIIIPCKKKVWCSEMCTLALQQYFTLPLTADETTPELLHQTCLKVFS